MSNNESFIDEVTEAVRRDKLYRGLKKYGWIGVVAVVALVGGASVMEWMKAREQAAAEATGDAVLEAVAAGDPARQVAALEAIALEGDAAAVVGLVEAGAETGDAEAAGTRLGAIAADPALTPLYRDLALLKQAMLPGQMSAEARIDALAGLTAPGAPFRVLAEEQIALAEIELGDGASAVIRLEALLEDNEASGALRQRAQQLIVALGGGSAAKEDLGGGSAAEEE